jgi:hypothetical protein
MFDISFMSKLIFMEYPCEDFDDLKMAEYISEEFNVICTEEDVKKYQQITLQHEDYELEQRKIKHYGHFHRY